MVVSTRSVAEQLVATAIIEDANVSTVEICPLGKMNDCEFVGYSLSLTCPLHPHYIYFSAANSSLGNNRLLENVPCYPIAAGMARTRYIVLHRCWQINPPFVQ